MAAKIYSLAACVMLFYDMALTFGDEVEKIWKQRFTGATVLWFLNRYLSPLGYIVVIVSFHDPSWSKTTCQRYVLFPEVLKVFTATAVGIIFILRLYSIYSKRTFILYGFGALLLAELGVKIWSFSDGTMLELPPGFVGCILTGDRIFGTWVAELVFDSVIFCATLYRTITLYRRTIMRDAQSLITVIMRDGIMYFMAIFASNLVTVMMFIFATPDLKVINASFSTLYVAIPATTYLRRPGLIVQIGSITTLMVSRLMLNLRSEVLRRVPVVRPISGRRDGQGLVSELHHVTTMTGTTLATTRNASGRPTLESTIIGNLGEPVLTFEHFEDDDEYELYKEQDDVAERDEEHAHAVEEDVEYGYPLSDLSCSTKTAPDTAAPPATPRGQPGIFPKLFGKRSNLADRRASLDGSMDQSRTSPSQLVVQVTEEVTVANDPGPAEIPRSRRPRSWLSTFTPPSPTFRRALSFSSPSNSPTMPTSRLSPELPIPPATIASRPSRSGSNPQTIRRSWAPPASWRLGYDRERDPRQPSESGS
ncbi:hypothetical protein PYCCODRAFT_360196 [Trametes coccinea BRFM310]|uniref:DUF6533 domain-containing protein n=1 Tax=Trametes coccinea (strain BRFM310) TaxID=1353009 RepID=A0A1Y2J380_TRAC3|nr:hypothetical protein PYCCODRAFT_360196 [Trametes coccinea BRFM310]